MSKKSLLIFLLFSLPITFQLFAQTADEQFLSQIEKNLDLSALKDNPVLDYAQSDSVINSINQESDSSFKARFYNLLGQLNFEKGDYAISLEYFLTAKDYVITADSKKELGALIFINIGNVYYRNEDYDAAKNEYKNGRTLALETEQIGLAATASNNIGLLYLKEEKIKNAEFSFKEALTLRKRLKDNYLIANSFQYLGMLKYHEQKMDSAAAYYVQAIQIAKKLSKGEKEKKLIISLSNNLSFCYLELGDIDKALSIANEVTILISEIEDQYFYCTSMNQTANVYLKCKDLKNAEKLASKIIETAGLENYFDLQQKAYSLLSKVKEQQGDFKTAIILSRKSQVLKSKIRHNFADKKLANERFGQQLIVNKKLLNVAKRESELKTRELNTQQIVKELLILLVIIILTALVSLIYSNREKQKSNKQLIATNNLIEKQNEANRKQQLELKLAKSQLELKVNELEQLTKNNNHLIGIVAHDLRTPLNSILGLCELLDVEVSDLPEEKIEETVEYVALMTESAGKMLDMINQILSKQSFEQKEIELKKKDIDISKMLNQLLLDHKKWADEKEISIEVNGNINQTKLYSDEMLILQVLSNLLSNSIKYSNPKTAVIINVSEQYDWVLFSVKDSGPGFSEKDKKGLFHPYRKLTASPTAEESSYGLGLSSAKKITEALHGKLWLESELNIGSTFFFELENGYS